MELTPITTMKAPQAIGPYSQAVRAGNLLFISGQLPIDPKTGDLNLFEGDVGKQTKLVLENMKAILDAANLTLYDVAKTTIFLKDMNQFATVNEVYATFFTRHKPARATVQVARLPKDADVEIEAVAYFREDDKKWRD